MSGGGEDVASVVRMLDQCMAGDAADANLLPQLLHLYRSSPRYVQAALSEKANAIVANATAGPVAARAGTLLVNVASYLDTNGASAKGKKGPTASGSTASVRQALLEHVLLLTGGKNTAAKNTAVRAQGCALVASLAPVVPKCPAAEAKLLEFSLDKVPSIRERAVRGLSGLTGNPQAELALIARTTDYNTAVRASAVRHLKTSRTTFPSKLDRINDVEAFVRAQLFVGFAEQPAAAEEFGPAALGRLVAALTDRSGSVRTAAGLAVDAWCKHFGGALALLERCDVTSDEALGDAVAAALAARYGNESASVAREWFGNIERSVKKAQVSVTDGPAPVLFARHAAAQMSEEDRDENLSVPLLLRRTLEALEVASHQAATPAQDFVLRQLLHVLVSADFCDEALRRRIEKLAEAVLHRAPLLKTADNLGSKAPRSAIDLGVLILRKCYGLGEQHSKSQSLEVECNTRVVLLVSDICQPLQGSGASDDHFTTRLSLQLQDLNGGVEELMKQKAALAQAKKKAIADEDFMEAQKVKQAAQKVEKELAELKKQQGGMNTERDGLCLRVLAIITALLRWSHSDLRKDPGLFGTLDTILRPMVSLPALSQPVELAAVSAICLFCVRDGVSAKGHWNLLLELLRVLRQVEGTDGQPASQGRHFRARATVAARTLADCARLHGGRGLDREEVLSAAHALAAVPFSARHVTVEPLCGWVLSLGHIFFEQHLLDPVLEVQWALGWMLVETFKQRTRNGEIEDDEKLAARSLVNAPEAQAAPAPRRQRGKSWVTRPNEQKAAAEPEAKEEVDYDDTAEAMALVSRLAQFFALLPKLPGKHGAPMLSLAVESIAESGLWRRAALLPHAVDGHTRWLRGFSWPQLFTFVHERVPAEMRFRLWRCSLQVCVASPSLAPLAEIPFALAQVAKDAPAGAQELVRQAIVLGADAAALAAVEKALPSDLADISLPEGAALLQPQAEAIATEEQRRSALSELGIMVDEWAPAEVKAPEIVPPHHRMRTGKTGNKKTVILPPRTEAAMAQENAAPAPIAAGEKQANIVAQAPSQPEEKMQPDAKRRRQRAKVGEAENVRLPLSQLGA